MNNIALKYRLQTVPLKKKKGTLKAHDVNKGKLKRGSDSSIDTVLDY